ncbi:MAG: hypothetical protein ACKOEG_12635 [Chthoniobacterales bacterium]
MDTRQPLPEQTSTPTPNERLWTADDLARYIGCSVREIRKLRYAVLPTIKFRHLIRFEPDAGAFRKHA